MEFEWDTAKAQSNAERHGIDFAEAMTVFGDPLEVTIPIQITPRMKPVFSVSDASERSRLLVVPYTEREGRIRLISAREAEPRERKTYEWQSH